MKKTRSELLERRKELTARLAAIRADLARGLAADADDQAIELENMEVLSEIRRVAEEELKQIDQSLAAMK